jgi:hypothetical protein
MTRYCHLASIACRGDGDKGPVHQIQTLADARSSFAVYEAACQSDAFVHEGCIKGTGRRVR